MTARACGQTRIETDGKDITEHVDVVLKVRANDPDWILFSDTVGTAQAVGIGGETFLLTSVTYDKDDDEFVFQTKQVTP